MRKLLILPCVALLTAAAPPPAITNQVAPSDGQSAVGLSGGGGTAVQAPEERKICRQLPSSNSRLPNRACLTAKQWQQVEDDASH